MRKLSALLLATLLVLANACYAADDEPSRVRAYRGVSPVEANGALSSPFEQKVERAVGEYAAGGVANIGDGRYFGGITPHHDAALGMIVRFYELASSRDARRVWLFSPDHFRQSRNIASLCDADWNTSGRTLQADREACAKLAELGIVDANAGMFGGEHGITLHIPLAARYFPNAGVVPVVLRPDAPDLALLILRDKIMELWNDGDVIILSMDLSHYKTPEGMAAEDVKTLDALCRLKYFQTAEMDADARRAASLVLRLFAELGAKRGVVIEHSDSSAVLGGRIESGTSYATITYGVE
ncbi:MAG: AmmeMemoRadiSam system protein B [Synergistaceae bacterium]|nr:AmmeMemoRadiSam system protein B [Synergistaceae bacterium]